MIRKTRFAAFLILLASVALAAQQPAPHPTTAAEAPNRDTSFIDAQGTAHVTRVVPVPATISPQAQAALAKPTPDQGPEVPLPMRRRMLGHVHGGSGRGMEPDLPQ